MTRPPPRSTLFPYTPLSRSGWDGARLTHTERQQHGDDTRHIEHTIYEPGSFTPLVRLSTTASGDPQNEPDRKSTRLNSSHSQISYAVFCLKKKKTREKRPVDANAQTPTARQI